MVFLRQFIHSLILLRYATHDKFGIGFEVVSLRIWIKLKKPITVNRVLKVVGGRHTTELHYLEHLIIIIFSWEYWRLDEKLDHSAAQ
jgi:hypothetical protein